MPARQAFQKLSDGKRYWHGRVGAPMRLLAFMAWVVVGGSGP
jgi:hypothetical protein